jgi:hypothetical protein
VKHVFRAGVPEDPWGQAWSLPNAALIHLHDVVSPLHELARPEIGRALGPKFEDPSEWAAGEADQG